MGALVLDGSQRASLAITRALGRAGIKVAVGESVQPNLAASSKYCHNSVTYASPISDPAQFEADIIKKVKTGCYKTIIPVTDVTSVLISRMCTALSHYAQLVMPEKETIEASLDKMGVCRLAKELDIPIPTTHFIDDMRQVREIASQLSYPVVIKPRYSWTFTKGRWVKAKVDYAFTPRDLIAKYYCAHHLLSFPMIQDLIVGPGQGIFVLMNRGKPKAFFAHRRLREKPLWGGESVLRESVPVDPVLQGYAVRLLEALNWHGVAMVEFKQDRAKSVPYLMELNGRFWGSLQLAVDAGMNFPCLLYDMITRGDIDTPERYRAGIRSRWFLGDLESLVWYCFKGNPFFWLPGKVKACKNFLGPSASSSEIFSRDDPQPWVVEILQYLRKLKEGGGKNIL